MNNHNKADGFERRLEASHSCLLRAFVRISNSRVTHIVGIIQLYLVENFKHAFDIERYVWGCGENERINHTNKLNGITSYVYYTQIMQAETLASAYRLWRRNWKGKGREYTAGALVWQVSIDINVLFVFKGR